MANDIDMWNDLEELFKTNKAEFKDLAKCFNARYIEGNKAEAEKLKAKFNDKYGYWGNYY